MLDPLPRVADALALVAAEPRVCAAVVDVNLRGEESCPVADALMARGVPFVFATGYADGELDARYPGVPRCIKPLEFRSLVRVLPSVLKLPVEER